MATESLAINEVGQIQYSKGGFVSKTLACDDFFLCSRFSL